MSNIFNTLLDLGTSFRKVLPSTLVIKILFCALNPTNTYTTIEYSAFNDTNISFPGNHFIQN